MGETGAVPLLVYFGADLEVPWRLRLFSFSDGNRRLEAKEDCGNRDSDVFHPWNHNSPWNRLLYPQLAGDPAGHNAAQLSLPPLLLVMWFSSLLNLSLFHGSVESMLPNQHEQENN